MTLTIILFAIGGYIRVSNSSNSSSVRKLMGCRQHDGCKKSIVDAAEYERDLPFNLHAKRSIEHIVILIGRVDKPRPGQWLFDYISRSLAISRDRVTSAWRTTKIYSACLSPCVASCVAALLRKVISFLLRFPLPASLSFSRFQYVLSSDRYTPDVNASVGDRARVRKRV